jgi:hypothetical protein
MTRIAARKSAIEAMKVVRGPCQIATAPPRGKPIAARTPTSE